MATCEAVQQRNNRDSKGRFQAGNTGRPAGIRNRSTCDYRVVRQQILDTWVKADGPAKLLKMANKDFPEFLKVLIAFKPVDLKIELEAIRPALESTAASAFHTYIVAQYGNHPTPADVMQALAEYPGQQALPVLVDQELTPKGQQETPPPS